MGTPDPRRRVIPRHPKTKCRNRLSNKHAVVEIWAEVHPQITALLSPTPVDNSVGKALSTCAKRLHSAISWSMLKV
jgi:hypothetical protein